ncbi:hypothetical protein FU656_00640 [Lacticaseibacillus rhamnosus]|nr:hypothetical protein FU656_00640 [Lacticaseibacillus rhamnosus]
MLHSAYQYERTFAIVFAVSFEKTVVRHNKISFCLNIKAINTFYLCMDRAPQCKDKACLVGQFDGFIRLSITRSQTIHSRHGCGLFHQLVMQ